MITCFGRRPRRLQWLIIAVAVAAAGRVIARAQDPTAIGFVRPIQPPRNPLPPEAQSAAVTQFSFIAYGDTRDVADGQDLQINHGRILESMLDTVRDLAATPFPVRFVVQSGDAVTLGSNVAMWNVSFTPLIERLTRGAGLPYFLAVGNHDVSGRPLGDPLREPGLRNTLAAMSRLWPADGSARRLKGYPTYALGYGNVFVILLDSNVASDPTQLEWVTLQLEGLDRARYRHVVAVFHHPPFSSGPHGGLRVELQTDALRRLYQPLFRRHHVRMTITGHEHLLEHWIERYEDAAGLSHRMDHLVTGGGGAPIYVYSAEPDLTAYVAAGASEKVQMEHLLKPGATAADNPHHFVVIRVDGDRLSLEVVAMKSPYLPYGRQRVELTDAVPTQP